MTSDAIARFYGVHFEYNNDGQRTSPMISRQQAVVLARVLGVTLDELVPKKARGLGAVLRHGRG